MIELTPEGSRLARSVNDALHEWESSLGLPLAADDAVEVLDLVDALGARPSRLTGRR